MPAAVPALARAAVALAVAAAAAAIGIAWLAAGSPETATAATSGAGAGLVCAVTAIAGAGWAQARGFAAKGALAVVVAGMLFRMVLVSIWAIVAFRVHEQDPIPFLAGFAALYLPGQLIEVGLLRPRAPRTP